MSNPEPNRDLSGNLIPRDGFIYDIVMRGYDTSFWKTLTGTPSIVSNKLRLNAEACASYYQMIKGKFNFRVNVPTTLSAGEAKKWGLLNAGDPTKGSMYFQIVGAVMNAVSYDNEGNVQTTVITSDFPGAVAEYEYDIEWGDDYINFLISGTVVATHKTRVGSLAQALYLINEDADNTDFGSIRVEEAGKIIG